MELPVHSPQIEFISNLDFILFSDISTVWSEIYQNFYFFNFMQKILYGFMKTALKLDQPNFIFS